MRTCASLLPLHPPTSVGGITAQRLLHNILIQEEEQINSTWKKISNIKSLNTVWIFIKLVGVSLGTSNRGKYEYAVTALQRNKTIKLNTFKK